jgi:hypothetical protein
VQQQALRVTLARLIGMTSPDITNTSAVIGRLRTAIRTGNVVAGLHREDATSTPPCRLSVFAG